MAFVPLYLQAAACFSPPRIGARETERVVFNFEGKVESTRQFRQVNRFITVVHNIDPTPIPDHFSLSGSEVL